MRELLVCPACRGRLTWGLADAACGCGRSYAVEDGIPVLLAGTDAHKDAQAAAHAGDPHPDRPRGTPALHGRLLAERLRRSTEGLDLTGRTAVVACGGPGMDAEHLVRRGAVAVVAVDIAPGAAREARDRFARLGLPALSVVGDAEQLPLADASVHLGYVLDGLHHLRDPRAGARELARVAREAVAISEPVQAGLTRLAVRTGLATDVEDAGNAVARVDPGEMEALLAAEGFGATRATRFAMHYDPEVGPLVRLGSRRRLLGCATAAALALARAGGTWGNKVAISGRRSAAG